METSGSGTSEYRAGGGKGEGKGESDGDEGVERRLARFAFVREERDREVRLLFRDVSPLEIVSAFKATGATLISISGERVLPAVGEKSDSPPLGDDAQPDEAQPNEAQPQQADKPDKSTGPGAEAGRQPGYITVMYFFDLDEIVYTVNIDVPSGIVVSVASVYPSARLSEDEIQKRLGATFVS